MFDYETIPLHWVNRLGFLVRKELGQRFQARGHHVSPEEWAVLLILWKDREQTPGAIADTTFRDRTTVTRLIDGMVKKQLVERDLDSHDRRKSIVRASDRGVELKDELVPIAIELITESLKGIDPKEIEITVRTLKAMTHNLLPENRALDAGQPSKDEQDVQLQLR